MRLQKALAAIDLSDGLAVLGLLCIAIGFGLVNVPAALVVVGTILLLLAVWPGGAPRKEG